MLPAQHRVRRPREFSMAVRSGTRTGGPLLVVHQLTDAAGASPARIGFVVSKAVGGSVVRTRVSRRLRAQAGMRLARLPLGSTTVVRALPAAFGATSADLGAALDRAFERLSRKQPA